MPAKLFEPVQGCAPKGYAFAFRMSELFPVEAKFRHHPQRHNQMLYDAVADNLRNGRTVIFPLGKKRHDRPCGISFTFEKHPFIVLLPEPMSTDTRVLLCAHDQCSESTAQRAAALFATSFVGEYRRFFSIDESHLA